MNPTETSMLENVSARHAIVRGTSVPFEMEWFFLDHNGNLIGFYIHNPEMLEALEDFFQTLRHK